MVEGKYLTADNITRIYQDGDGRSVHALDQFHLECSHSEILAIVGPSGCGKSTFLRLAAGLDQPQSGRLEYNGQKIEGAHPGRSLVFQEANLFPWLTVFENIAFGLKARGVYKKEKRFVQEYIDQMGLQGFEKAYPYQISGGMASRTALARTFIQRPGVILLDEPFSALDAFTKVALQDDLLEIWKGQKPIIILVTHDIEEAVYLSDRVAIMSRRPGRIIGEVKIDLKHPRDRISKSFVEKRREILDILGSEESL